MTRKDSHDGRANARAISEAFQSVMSRIDVSYVEVSQVAWLATPVIWVGMCRRSQNGVTKVAQICFRIGAALRLLRDIAGTANFEDSSLNPDSRAGW